MKGARLGQGSALAVCRPGTLQEAVDALRACVAADAIVIPQGANTGLTGGSVPRDDTHRSAVVLNMRRMNKIHEIEEEGGEKGDDGGNGAGAVKMLCLAGAGIHDLSVRAKSIGRESHSILGSTFLNPTVAAGVSLGSGGSQIRKGPVYTERCLWCKVTEDGKVELFNTTGFEAPTEEELLRMIEEGAVGRPASSSSSSSSSSSFPPASDAVRYCQDLCDHSQEQETKVSRFNADTRGIDPVRSEGKVLILASVHDTFPVPRAVRNVWVSCDSLETAQKLKKKVMLVNPIDLPISCEYMNKDTMDVIDQGGRALCHSLLQFGIGPKFEHLWDLKIKIESMKILGTMFETLPDKILYAVNSIFPSVLPSEVAALSKKFDHHMLISVGDFGNGEINHFEDRLALFLRSEQDAGGRETSSMCVVRDLDEKEAKRVGVFRFAAAPAFRTWCVGRNLSGISLDYALPKNHTTSPDMAAGGPLRSDPVVRCRYSHFGCNVVHEDVAFESSVDVYAKKMDIKHIVEKEGGKLPAEHGHGTEYEAPTNTQLRWREMDPRNVFNPGVGGTRTEKFYGRK